MSHRRAAGERERKRTRTVENEWFMSFVEKEKNGKKKERKRVSQIKNTKHS